MIKHFIKTNNRGYSCICICDNCKKEYKETKAKATRYEYGYCSRKCSGLAHSKEKHPNWRGGFRHHEAGYILALNKEHPYAECHGYVRLSRLVMEQALGRYLKPKEIVHHINGNVKDNRIENLELMSNSEHSKLGAINQWQKVKLSGGNHL